MGTVAADAIFIFPDVYLGEQIVNILYILTLYIDFHGADDSDAKVMIMMMMISNQD